MRRGKRDKMGNLELNEKRAVELCQIVLDAYEKKKGIFSQKDIEKRMLPEKRLVDVIEYKERVAKWFFFTTPGDKLIDSTTYYKQLKEFYLDNPTFFDNRSLENERIFNAQLNNEFLNKVKVAIPLAFGEFTVKNAQKLLADFKGNPLNALTSDDFKQSVKDLKQFMGYGTGESTLYLIFLTRYKIKETKDLAPKVDRHFVKISAGCGVFEAASGLRTDKAAEKLSRLYKKICDEHKFNAVLLDPTVWIIGHDLCSKNNSGVCRLYCPLDDYCDKDLPRITRKARLHKKEYNKRDQLALTLSFERKEIK